MTIACSNPVLYSAIMNMLTQLLSQRVRDTAEYDPYSYISMILRHIP